MQLRGEGADWWDTGCGDVCMIGGAECIERCLDMSLDRSLSNKDKINALYSSFEKVTDCRCEVNSAKLLQ